jgi:predicted nucleic acid-binding protein
MSVIVVLDAGPLGMITNPRSSPENERCKDWLASLVQQGTGVVIPEIADYEVRRELLRADKTKGLARLDALKSMLTYLPITTPAMLKAAEFWAVARKRGSKSAADASLDADVILAAQAALLSREGDQAIIATTNVRHLGLFTAARNWRQIG